MIQNSSSKFQCELFILPPIFNSSTKNNLNELNIKIKQTFLFSPNLLENLFIPISLSEDNEKLNKNILKIFPEDILCSNRSCLGKDNSSPQFLFVAYPLYQENNKNEQRRRIRLQAKLTLLSNNRDDFIIFENVFNKWIGTFIAPHQPLTNSSTRRRILVLLNPFSGQQQALSLWTNEVEMIWREAGYQIEIIVTERPLHATELAEQICLDRVDILALGGADHKRALRLPILHLPMGTGNALASSIAYQANPSLHFSEPFPPRGSFCQQMALMAIRPNFNRLCLYQVEIEGGRRKGQNNKNSNQCKIMFLSLSWGLMADIDIGSERFRFLGMARLHLEAFLRVAFLPYVARYKARISYLPLPEGRLRNKIMEKMRMRVEERREEIGKEEEESEDFEEMIKGIEIPPLDQPVPSNWQTIEEEFCFVHIAALSHIGSDLPYIPSAKLDNPVLFLTFVQWQKISHRLHMAKILLSIDTSDHLDDTAFEIIPILACRVNPEKDAGGWLALDGEAVINDGKNSSMSFQVGPGKYKNATIIGRQRR
uniref:DAGKc domain-containing protein n=1 Tax=Meloidogyne floridensis TaxID=298350 RepID=A0A915P0E5_9BILA